MPKNESLASLDTANLTTTAELRKTLESALKPNPEKNQGPDPRDQVEYPFHFRYVDARGKTWEGDFVHRIPTLAQRDLIDLLQAKKKANIQVESFSMMAATRHLFMSHLEVCLVERPDWAKNLDALHDPKIVELIYQEAASHEAHFLGWGRD